MAVKPLAQSETNKTTETTTLQKPNQSGKLQRVLADLKITVLPISDKLCNRLIEVVRKYFDVFAASPTDIGRT